MTPASFSLSLRLRTVFIDPRSLYDPVRCMFSIFRYSLQWVRLLKCGDRCKGDSLTYWRIALRAAWTSFSVTEIAEAIVFSFSQPARPRAGSASRSRGTSGVSTQGGDAFDLDQHIEGQAGDLHRRARRGMPPEGALVDRIHARKILQTAEEDRGLQHLRRIAPSCLQHSSQILEDLLRLRLNTAFHHFHGFGIEGNLPRAIDQFRVGDSLAVRPEGFRCPIRRNGFHTSAPFDWATSTSNRPSGRQAPILPSYHA